MDMYSKGTLQILKFITLYVLNYYRYYWSKVLKVKVNNSHTIDAINNYSIK